MFEQATLEYARGGKRAWSTFAGFTGQSLLIAVAVIAPMIWPQVLPRPQELVTGLWVPSPPPPAPPPAMARVIPHRSQIASQFRENVLIVPTRIPESAISIEDPPPATGSIQGVPGGVGYGQEGGRDGGILNSILGVVPAAVPQFPKHPPAPPPKAVSLPPRIVVPGGRVRLARCIFQPQPEYPPLARAARISGAVQLEGIITVDGHIRALTVLSGHPLLVNAAVEAVKRWLYEPTTLNGEPVEVRAPITVIFQMK